MECKCNGKEINNLSIYHTHTVSNITLNNLFTGRDKTINSLQHRFWMPLVKERVQMYIKYCEPCQHNNTQQLEKCPQQMVLIKVEAKVWSQIGKTHVKVLYTCTGKKEEKQNCE